MKTKPDSVYVVPYKYVFEETDFPLAVKPMFSAPLAEEHTHENFTEIVIVAAGKANYRCGGLSWRIAPGDVLVTLPGTNHIYTDCKELDYYNILVDFNNLRIPLFDLSVTEGWQQLFVRGPRLCNSGGKTTVRYLLGFDDLDTAVKLLDRLIHVQSRKDPGYHAMMFSLFYSLLALLCGAGRPCDGETENRSPSIVIGEIALVLSRECDKPWPVDRLCKSFNMSRPVLFREFQKYYNTSPGLFLLRQRVRKAMSLLDNSKLSIEMIADQCGFSCGNYFATAFRKQTGMTPLQFRKSVRDPGLVYKNWKIGK